MSDYDPLAQVQDYSVGAASSGVAVSREGPSLEAGLLPVLYGRRAVGDGTQPVGGQGIPFTWILLAGAVGLGLAMWKGGEG